MARSLGTASVSLTRSRRTWRTNIESIDGTLPVATFHRELIGKDPDGNVVEHDDQAGVVTRTIAGNVLAEEVTLHDGTVLTVAQIAEAIPMLCDMWEEEDEAE